MSQSERCFECIASHHKCIAILGSTTKHLNARERPKSKGKEKRNRLHIWWWEFVIRVGYQQCSNQNDLNGYFTGCSIKMTPKRKTWCFDTFHLSHLHLNVIWLVVIYLWLIIRPFYRDKKYIKTAVRYTFAFLCVCVDIIELFWIETVPASKPWDEILLMSKNIGLAILSME